MLVCTAIKTPSVTSNYAFYFHLALNFRLCTLKNAPASGGLRPPYPDPPIWPSTPPSRSALVLRCLQRLSGTGIVECFEITDVGCNLKQFDGLTWLTWPPYFWDRSTRLSPIRRTVAAFPSNLLVVSLALHLAVDQCLLGHAHWTSFSLVLLLQLLAGDTAHVINYSVFIVEHLHSTETVC